MHAPIVRAVSILTITIILAAVIAPLITIGSAPTALAQSVEVELSRTTVYLNNNVTITITDPEKAGADNVTVLVTVAGIPMTLNFSAKYAGVGVFYGKLGVNETGYVTYYWYDRSAEAWVKDRVFPENLTSTANEIKIEYKGITKVITFEHTAATLNVEGRETDGTVKLPYPVNETGCKDWKITAPDLNKDPETTDSFQATITVSDETKGETYTITVTFRETGGNTGVFEPTQEYIFNKTHGAVLEPSDTITVTVKVPKYHGATTYDSITKDLEVFRTAGTVEVVEHTLKSLKIKVVDESENKRSYKADSVPINITWCNGTTKQYNATEAEDEENTGVFYFTLALYKELGSGINSTCNEITVTYKDPSEGTVREKDVEISYHKASVEISPSEITLPKARIALTINDPDLDVTTDPDSYTITIAKDTPMLNKTISINGYTVAKISLALVIVDKDGNEHKVYPNVTTAYTIVLRETDDESGVFTATIDLGKFDITAAMRSVNGTQVKELKIIYIDMLNPDLKPVTVEATAAVKPVSIEADRTEVPLTQEGDVVIHVTVHDSSANVNEWAQDTVSNTTLTVTAYDSSGKKYVFTTSNASISELKETDIDTGVFKGTITLDKDALMPYFKNGKLVIEYTNTYGASASVTLYFRVYSAELTVNGTSSVSVDYGDKVVVKLVCPDYNLDNSDTDYAYITVVYPNGTTSTIKLEETDVNSSVFEAEITIAGTTEVAGTTLEFQAGKTLKFKYTDKTPQYVPSTATSWPSTGETYEVSVYVKSYTGKITTNKKEYGPGATIVVTITDPDQNRYPDDEDVIETKDTIFIRAWDGTTIELPSDYNAEETDVSTGDFTFKITVDDILKLLKSNDVIPEENVKYLLGKSITFLYRDPVDEKGSVRIVSATVSFTSWDGEIKTYKGTEETNTFNVGDIMKIVIYDPDQNKNPDERNKIYIRVYSTSDPIGKRIEVFENDTDSGYFVTELKISDSTDAITRTGYIYAKLGDKITIEYKDEHPANYGETGESKVITHEVTVGYIPPTPMEPTKVSTIDPNTGAPKTTIKPGDLVGISVEIKNRDIEDHSVAVILVIRDARGVAVQIQYQVIYIAAGKTVTAGFTWEAGAPGSYTVEVYIVKSLTDRSPMTEKVPFTSPLTVSE